MHLRSDPRMAPIRRTSSLGASITFSRLIIPDDRGDRRSTDSLSSAAAVMSRRSSSSFVELVVLAAMAGHQGQPPAEDAFRATAARTRALKAFSSTSSPSWRSMARLVLPPKPALKRPAGSSRVAPLRKVSFTLSL